MRFSPSGSASGAVKATGKDTLEYKLRRFLAKKFLAKRSLAKSFLDKRQKFFGMDPERPEEWEPTVTASAKTLLAKRQNFFGMDPEPPEDWEPTVTATAKTFLAKHKKRSLAKKLLAKRSQAKSFLADRQNFFGMDPEPPEDWEPTVTATAKTFLAKRNKRSLAKRFLAKRSLANSFLA